MSGNKRATAAGGRIIRYSHGPVFVNVLSGGVGVGWGDVQPL